MTARQPRTPKPDTRMLAWRRFLEAHASLVEVLERELQAERGIPLAWYDVLVQLAAAPAGRMRLQQLAAAVLISKSGLTRLLDRIQQAGLVARQSCAEDRRGTFAAITPAGRRALRAAAPVHRRGIRRYFAERLTDDDAEALAAALSRVLEGLPRRSGAPA